MSRSAAVRFAMGLVLVWAGCCTLADGASPVTWWVKLWGLQPWRGTPGALEPWAITGLLAVLLVLPQRWHQRTQEALSVVMSAIATAGLLGWALGVDSRAGFGPIDPDQFGALCAFGVLLGVWARNPVALGLCVLGLMASKSLGALMGLGAGALLLWGWPVLMPIAAGGFALVLLRHGAWSFDERWWLVKQGAAAVWAKPWGWGHAGWVLAFWHATPQGVMWTVNDRVHEIVLDWAVIAGVPGTAALVALCVLALWRARHLRALIVCYLVCMLFLFETWASDALLMLLVSWALCEKEPRHALTA